MKTALTVIEISLTLLAGMAAMLFAVCVASNAPLQAGACLVLVFVCLVGCFVARWVRRMKDEIDEGATNHLRFRQATLERINKIVLSNMEDEQ